MERVIPLIVRLYAIVDELEAGEAWAQSMFDLELLPGSTKTHDAKTKDGRLVQIKATQGASVAIYDEPNYLVVLKLLSSGKADVARSTSAHDLKRAR